MIKLLAYILTLVAVVFIIIKRGSVVAGFATMASGNGKVGRAFRLYRLAEKIGGMNYNAKVNYGYFLLKNAHLEEARVEFNKISMERKLSDAQRNQVKSLQSLVVWKEGNLDEAIEMLEEVTQTYVTSMTYQSLGLLYILKRDKKKALDYCLEAHEYNPEDNVIMDNLAEAYALCGETEKAMETYEALLKRNPHFPDAYYGYGMLLIQNGRREEGLDYLEQSLNKNFSFLSALPRERVENIYYAHKEIVNETKQGGIQDA